MNDCRNPNGTVNGVKYLSKITGIPEAEVEWTWSRLKELMCAEGKTKEEARVAVAIERLNKPWLKENENGK